MNKYDKLNHAFYESIEYLSFVIDELNKLQSIEDNGVIINSNFNVKIIDNKIKEIKELISDRVDKGSDL